MRKSVISIVAAGMLGSGAFLTAAHAADPPTYSSPCGQSVETGPPPGSPTPILPTGTSGEVGLIGPDGYIEAVGNASTQSGHISGATSSSRPTLYGSVGNDAGGPSVCAGTGPSPLVKVP